MAPNPVLEELRRARENLLAEAGGTLAGLVAKLQQDEKKSGRIVLSANDLPGRHRVTSPTPAESPDSSTTVAH